MRHIPAALAALVFVIIIAIAWTVYASPGPQAQEYAQYTNERWAFLLVAPDEMTVDEYEAEGGGQRIQFSDASGDRIFTIAAWPYTQYDLTLGREGTPSMAADQPDHLEIVDVVRDDTLTFLFQKNGVRYVVVALPEDEPWLADILSTWRFIE
jgi:hypothetical protein